MLAVIEALKAYHISHAIDHIHLHDSSTCSPIVNILSGSLCIQWNTVSDCGGELTSLEIFNAKFTTMQQARILLRVC